jgi:hypothetical protein
MLNYWKEPVAKRYFVCLSRWVSFGSASDQELKIRAGKIQGYIDRLNERNKEIPLCWLNYVKLQKSIFKINVFKEALFIIESELRYREQKGLSVK